MPNRRLSAETVIPFAPWSAHALTFHAQDSACAESLTMTLESIVPGGVVPEVERLLKVRCRCRHAVLC